MRFGVDWTDIERSITQPFLEFDVLSKEKWILKSEIIGLKSRF